ncbi:MAG: cytochrome oxidase [Burkholderiales bacterium]|nr:cytochrome oxidase [Burkholderiales bacterium]
MSMQNTQNPDLRKLIKFFLMSAISFAIGTIHGTLQVLPPIRAWLDSIGSPYGGPGHMIDPLAHAHINLVGGLVMLGMGVTYYMLPILSGREIYSWKLVNHTFWWTALGVLGFYFSQVGFGIWEGFLFLSHPEQIPAIHHYYGLIISASASTMVVGFCSYLANIILTLRRPS